MGKWKGIKMTKSHKAHFQIITTIEFEDDGELDIRDQAMEAMEDMIPSEFGDYELQLYLVEKSK